MSNSCRQQEMLFSWRYDPGRERMGQFGARSLLPEAPRYVPFGLEAGHWVGRVPLFEAGTTYSFSKWLSGLK